MFRRRHLQVKLVKDDDDMLEFPHRTQVVFAANVIKDVERAGQLALKLYTTKKLIDFAAHAAEHIVVTKIR